MLKSAITPASPASSSSGTCDTKPNRKYWGEECQDDAVYNIYLKKITYSTKSSHIPCVNLPDSGISSLSSGSAEADLVDGLQRVFRRRSSFDKGLRDLRRSPNKKNVRSASVSALLGYQHHQHQHAFQHHKSSTEFLNGSLLCSEYGDNSRIRIKNYQKLSSDADSLQSLRTSSSSPGHQVSSPGDQTTETSMLQWETRQIKILKAATLSHIVKYILFLTDRQIELQSKHEPEEEGNDQCQSIVWEEERNNVSHVVHVFFAAYRLFTTPVHLFQLIYNTFRNHVKNQQGKLVKQLNFILLYWLNNYPEDFVNKSSDLNAKILHPLTQPTIQSPSPVPSSVSENLRSDTSSSQIRETSEKDCASLPELTSVSGSNHTPSSTEKQRNGRHVSRDDQTSNPGPDVLPDVDSAPGDDRLVDALLNIADLDESIHRKAVVLLQDFKPDSYPSDASDNGLNGKCTGSSTSSSIQDLDARFIAQQLTAIDLESFLCLKPYFLLEGTRSNAKVQATIKNFNHLSRQVIMTILKSNAPDAVTGHWIEVALHLRRLKNFNSLKAVIAGLTNESIYRLKNMVWSKMTRTTLSNFKMLSSIVDDVNNQTVLRQTQLEMEGTAKVSLQDDYSFGVIPYLGTFFTDLTFIDSRYSSTIPSKRGEKMINLEKCCKQFEVLTQVQLLQKNLRASLSAFNQSQKVKAAVFSPTASSSDLLAAPRVTRLFRNWFSDQSAGQLSDNDCYKLSLALEPPVNTKK